MDGEMRWDNEGDLFGSGLGHVEGSCEHRN